MKVRDRTLKKTEYKGRETDAFDERCPCRPCWHPHNVERDSRRYYSDPDMQCVTRYNGGCPTPQPEPQHIYTPRGRVCRRCGARR